jgi:hypothetical protein
MAVAFAIGFCVVAMGLVLFSPAAARSRLQG